MGWTVTHKPKSVSVSEFLTKRFTSSNEHGTWEVLGCAVVRFRTAYMATKRTFPGGRTYVFGTVVLLKFFPSEPEYNFGWKEIDESMGPCECECPEKILRMLTPLNDPSNSYANSYVGDWREACWIRINTNKAKTLLKIGMRLRHPDGIRFRDGSVLHEFTVLSPRSTLVADVKGVGRYRLTKLLIDQCQVIKAATEEEQTIAA